MIQYATRRANEAARALSKELGYEEPDTSQVDELEGIDDAQILRNSRPPFEERIGHWLLIVVYKCVRGIKWLRSFFNHKQDSPQRGDCSGCSRKGSQKNRM
jgi:hypothetical protein